MTPSPSSNCDVLIVGGGPAGLATGIVCARNGLKTIVIEKNAYPLDKACGEGIMPTGVEALCKLGLIEGNFSDRYFPFKGIRYRSTQGHIAEASFLEGPGWGIQRIVLSERLYEVARIHTCLQIITDEKAIRISSSGDAFITQTGLHDFHSRMIVGADGLHSSVRTWINASVKGRTRQRWGIRRHYAVRPWSDYVEVEWGDGVEAYITPVGPETVNIAFLWSRPSARSPLNKEDLFESFLRQFPPLANRIRGHDPLDAIRAIGPLEQRVSHTTADGVVLIGDSAGYIDAITGEGISLALESAMAFEEKVVPLLLGKPGILPVSELEPFSRAQGKLFDAYARMANLALSFSNHPRISDLAIWLLHQRPGLFQFLLSCNLGKKQLWPGILNPRHLLHE